MSRETRIIVGILLALVGLWGGAYLCHLYHGSWQELPAFLTAFAFGISGVGLTVSGFVYD